MFILCNFTAGNHLLYSRYLKLSRNHNLFYCQFFFFFRKPHLHRSRSKLASLYQKCQVVRCSYGHTRWSDALVTVHIHRQYKLLSQAQVGCLMKATRYQQQQVEMKKRMNPWSLRRIATAAVTCSMNTTDNCL